VIRLFFPCLAVLLLAPGCQTTSSNSASSKLAPLAFWRPKTEIPAEPQPQDSLSLDSPYDSRMTSRPERSYPMPQTRPDGIPPAPSFDEPQPTLTPPHLFPMQ